MRCAAWDLIKNITAVYPINKTRLHYHMLYSLKKKSY